jgi:hypothetical protein
MDYQSEAEIARQKALKDAARWKKKMAEQQEKMKAVNTALDKAHDIVMGGLKGGLTPEQHQDVDDLLQISKEYFAEDAKKEHEEREERLAHIHLANLTRQTNQTAAIEWWSAEKYTGKGGVMVLSPQGVVQGWCNALRDPDHWIAGCVAIDEAGKQWVATGGDTKNGAECWEPIYVFRMNPTAIGIVK